MMRATSKVAITHILNLLNLNISVYPPLKIRMKGEGGRMKKSLRAFA
jgi:hypothetical protein